MNRTRRSFLPLAGSLAAGLILGLALVFLMPPWQHYDEPNHFEVAWLFANHAGRPQPGDSDQVLNRQLVASMVVNRFYRNLPYTPDPNQTGPVSIGGYSQLDEPPLYYWLVSWPLRLLKDQDIVLQLRAARLVSLLLLLVCIMSAYGLAVELFPEGNPLRWLLPLSVALLPGFVDVMTAVNNDVAAITAGSLFLWAGARLIQRGLGWGRLLAACAAAGLCLLSKSTAYLALPLLAVAILFGVTPLRWRWLALALLALTGIAGLIVTLQTGDAAQWYRSSAQTRPNRSENGPAPLGRYVFQMEPGAGNTPAWSPQLFQPLTIRTARSLRGQVVTLGAWMWASQPAEVTAPILGTEQAFIRQQIELTTSPEFYIITATLPSTPGRVWVSLDPAPISPSAGLSVYADGLVLVEGAMPAGTIPAFSDPDGQQGAWAGQQFSNLLANASAEQAGWRFRPWVDDLGARFLPDHTRPSLILASVLDFPQAVWFYRLSATRLLHTFWGELGWGHVPLPGRPYRGLILATLVLCAAALIALWRRGRRLPIAVLWLGLALFLGWGIAVIRGPAYLAQARLYLPVARYALPVILPTVLMLSGGWHALWGWIRAGFIPTRLEGWQFSSVEIMVYFILLLALDALALIGIFQYYAVG